MDEQQLRQLFPRASEAFIKANATTGPRDHQDQSPRPDPKLEHRHADEPGPTAPDISKDARRFVVRVESVRRQLLDQDNLCEKFLVDGLRYSGLIPNDSPAEISLETTQRKTRPGEEEHTNIEIIRPIDLTRNEAI